MLRHAGWLLAILSILMIMMSNYHWSKETSMLWAQNDAMLSQITELRLRYDRIKEWAETYRQQEYANYIEMGGN